MRRSTFFSATLAALLSAPPAFGAEQSAATQGPPERAMAETDPGVAGPTYADRLFEHFVERYFKGYFDARPTEATDLGFHDRDSRLPNLSRGALGKEMERLRAAYAELNTIDPVKLQRDNGIDRRLLLSSISAAMLELGEVRSWQRQPAYYTDVVSGAVYSLVKRNFAPAADRLRSVVARERAVPGLLRVAQENLDNPPKLWVDIAIEETEGTVGFLRNDVPQAFAGVGDAALQAEFAESTRLAADATQQYLVWLRDWLLPRANGDFRLGEATFRKKLLFEEMVDTSIEQLLTDGFAELERQQGRFARTAAEIDPTATGQEVLAKLSHQHTKPENLLADTRQLLTSLRDFCIEHDIVDLPSLEMPIVAETPPFARAFTFASMDPPGAFEQGSHEAYFYMTLPEAGWTPDHVEEHMQAYWRGDIANTAIHEAFPGHYVQFLWLPYSPTFTRKILGANSFVEGWAHYTEEMFLEEGYGDQDPELWLSAEQWALVRVCRYLVGILMHTRGMTLEAATAFFEKNAYLPHANALREAMRGTADPTYLYYTLGKLQILELRRDVQAIEGPRFSLRRFHDRLLSQGMAPVAIAREGFGFAMARDEAELDAEEAADRVPRTPIEAFPNVPAPGQQAGEGSPGTPTDAQPEASPANSPRGAAGSATP